MKTRLKWQIVKLTTKLANHVHELFYYCKLHKSVDIFTHLARPSTHQYAQFWPPLHQNMFGGRSLPNPLGELTALPKLPTWTWGRAWCKGRIGRGRDGEWWVRVRARGRRGKRLGERHGKGQERGGVMTCLHQCWQVCDFILHLFVEIDILLHRLDCYIAVQMEVVPHSVTAVNIASNELSK